MSLSDSPSSPEVIGVIGAGSMGAGIAQVAAQAGHTVWLYDTRTESVPQAIARMADDLKGAVQRGRLSADAAQAALERVRPAVTLADLAPATVVIEAIVERLDVKQQLFTELEALVTPDALLCSNTSSLSITAIAQPLRHPQRVAGWHFFNPATRMKLVEIIAGVATDAAVLDRLTALSRAWGKTPVAAPNAPGFIVNRVARPFYAEGLRLAGERIAPLATIDALARRAGGFALGPFELMDLIGVDVNLSVTESVFQATACDSRYAPHLLQQECVRSGRFGRKTGHGYYRYEGGQIQGAGVTPVAPAAHSGPLAVAADAGALTTLVQRLRDAGVQLATDAALPAGTLAVGAVHVRLSDGRTADHIAHQTGQPHLLLDLAADWGKVELIGVAASHGAQPALAELAAALQPAGVALAELDDVAGLVVLRLVACLANEAADVLTWSATRAADIDTAMRLGTAYPKGPLAWADELGAAHIVQVLEHLQAHYGDPRYRPSPRLRRAAWRGQPLTAAKSPESRQEPRHD